MPGWNPLTSAASGAAFAGLLAALVIAVSIQIAFQSSGSRRDQFMSLKAATPTLMTLMVAAYLYIVLDGIPSSAAEVTDAVVAHALAAGAPVGEARPGPAEIAEAAIAFGDLAARGFAASGTVLALGALMTLFVVVASVFDNTDPDPRLDEAVGPGEQQAREWARAVLRVAVLTLVIILALGYRVGAELAGENISAGWWVLHLAALSGAPLAALGWLAVRRWRGATFRLPTMTGPSAPLACVAVLTALPALVVLSLITAGTDHADVVPLVALSAGSGLYYGLAAAVLLLLIETRDSTAQSHPKGSEARLRADEPAASPPPATPLAGRPARSDPAATESTPPRTRKTPTKSTSQPSPTGSPPSA